jgi:hypothetical protein
MLTIVVIDYTMMKDTFVAASCVPLQEVVEKRE